MTNKIASTITVLLILVFTSGCGSSLKTQMLIDKSLNESEGYIFGTIKAIAYYKGDKKNKRDLSFWYQIYRENKFKRDFFWANYPLTAIFTSNNKSISASANKGDIFYIKRLPAGEYRLSKPLMGDVSFKSYAHFKVLKNKATYVGAIYGEFNSDGYAVSYLTSITDEYKNAVKLLKKNNPNLNIKIDKYLMTPY